MKTKTPGLDILNCGTGHTEIHFKPDDPIEAERAKRIITDMLRRGYVLFLEGEGKALHRVTSFDETRGVYIIADGPLYAGDQPDPVAPVPPDVTAQTKPRRGRPRKVEVPMGSVRATAIGRSAGG